jgi:hypothetical protein
MLVHDHIVGKNYHRCPLEHRKRHILVMMVLMTMLVLMMMMFPFY